MKRKAIPRKLRLEIYEDFDYKCFDCGKPHERMMPLQIHHIDDNVSNNNKDNLVLLCLSCHNKTKQTHKDYWERVRSGNNFLVSL